MRDLELFRTLLRLRYLSTALIAKYFFPNDRIARRRLDHLRLGGFLRRHEKGLYGWDGMRYWRVTSRAIDCLAEAYQAEPVANRIMDRLRDGSLSNQWEREELAQVYLTVVTRPPEPAADTRKAAACFRWSAQIRGRADQIHWQPAYDVILRYQYAGEVHRIVPHATLTAPVHKLRIFIDLAEGSGFGKPTNRFGHYAKFLQHVYPQVFPDGYEPLVVVISRNETRVKRIAHEAKRILPTHVRWRVALPSEAAQWLQPVALPPPRRDPMAPEPSEAPLPQPSTEVGHG
jgi:hypothetical protein